MSKLTLESLNERMEDAEFYIENLRKAALVVATGMILSGLIGMTEIRDENKRKIENIAILYRNKLITKEQLIETLNKEYLGDKKWQKKYINTMTEEQIFILTEKKTV